MIVNEVGNLSSTARDRSQALSRFSKFQEKVRGVFTSNAVQKFIAFLIFSVITTQIRSGKQAALFFRSQL